VPGAVGQRVWGSGLVEGAVWPVVVVVLRVPGKRCCSVVLLVDDEDAVEELAADGADEAFGDRVRPGCWTGVLMIFTLVAVNTVSKATVSLASRSRMRNRNRHAVSSGSMVRLRANWVSHVVVGCAVTPRMWTRRVACSMTKNAYSRRRAMVSR